MSTNVHSASIVENEILKNVSHSSEHIEMRTGLLLRVAGLVLRFARFNNQDDRYHGWRLIFLLVVNEIKLIHNYNE